MGSADIIDSWLAYDTVRYARIKHKGLGLMFYAGCVAIATYIVVFEIAMSGSHFTKEGVRGFTYFSLEAPGYKNCAVGHKDCKHIFTSDENLPYCERFVKHKNGEEIHGPKPELRRPCALYDGRDAVYGNMDDQLLIVPTRTTSYFQEVGCPEKFDRDSGFGNNHSSYFCKTLWHEVNATEPLWDGYTIEPERFRVMILHGMTSLSTERDYFLAHTMQGFVEDCSNKSASGVCEMRKIPCVSSRCGMTDKDKKAMMTSRQSLSSVENASSFSQVTKGISDRQVKASTARFHKSQSHSLNNNLRVGLQNHLGFLEFIPPDVQGSVSSRYFPGSISQEKILSGSFPDSNGNRRDTDLSDDFSDNYEAPNHLESWRRVIFNVDNDVRRSVDLDSGIYQGKYGLITSVGFLLRLAGVTSLDDQLRYLSDNTSYVPRDWGVNLKITFEYTNVDKDKFHLFPRATPSYTMKVWRAKPARYMFRMRVPSAPHIDDRHRKEIHIHALKFSSLHIGVFASFEFGQLFIVLTSGLGLFAALVSTLDFVCTYVAPFRKQFSEDKYKEFDVGAQVCSDPPREVDEDVQQKHIAIKRMGSKEALSVASVEHDEKNVTGMMKAIEDKLKETISKEISAKDSVTEERFKDMIAKDREREEMIKEMLIKDCAREEMLTEMVAKDCAKEERLKEMATKIARLEALLTSNTNPRAG